MKFYAIIPNIFHGRLEEYSGKYGFGTCFNRQVGDKILSHKFIWADVSSDEITVYADDYKIKERR